MNQNKIIIICLVISTFAVLFGAISLTKPEVVKNLGIAANQVSFSKGVVNATTTCGATIATDVDATNSARTSFIFGGVASGSGATLCRSASSSGCTKFGGIMIAASTTASFIQTDGYVGPYSCISTGNASSDVGYSKSP